jgi:hypothetical protein
MLRKPLHELLHTSFRHISDAGIAMSDSFIEVMGRFAIARPLLAVCHRSLTTNEAASGGCDEAEVLADAIEKLRQAYDDLDTLAGP